MEQVVWAGCACRRTTSRMPPRPKCKHAVLHDGALYYKGNDSPLRGRLAELIATVMAADAASRNWNVTSWFYQIWSLNFTIIFLSFYGMQVTRYFAVMWYQTQIVQHIGMACPRLVSTRKKVYNRSIPLPIIIWLTRCVDFFFLYFLFVCATLLLA